VTNASITNTLHIFILFLCLTIVLIGFGHLEAIMLYKFREATFRGERRRISIKSEENEIPTLFIFS